MSKTIIYNPDWDKTIVRYHDLPPTVVASGTSTAPTLILPATVLYTPDSAPRRPAPVPSVIPDDIYQVASDLLQGNLGVISQYLNPIHFTLQPGDNIGVYTILQKIGEGAFAKIYQAKHPLKQTPDVIKIINPLTGIGLDTTHLLHRYEQEYLVGQVDSAYIIRSREKGFFKGHPFIVSEMADGGDLGQQIRNSLSIGLLDKIALDVLQGLADIHALGIVHRDLKPQNIYLSGSTFKIGDFGVATMLNPSPANDASITDGDHIYGTYGYMAPELFEGNGPQNTSPQQDIFSFGCMMFQLLTGVLPFGEITNTEDITHYIYNCRNGLLRPLRKLRKDIPSYWEDIIYACVQGERQERIASAREVIDLLQTQAGAITHYQTGASETLRHYPYDFLFSFSEKNRLLAIEIYSFLQHKGFKVLLDNDLFGSNKQGQENSQAAKYRLVLHTEAFVADLTEETARQYPAENLILYEVEPIDSLLKSRKNVISVQAKAHIIKLVEGWQQEPLLPKDEQVKVLVRTKNDLLTYIARNELPKAITAFLDLLRSTPGNDEIKKSLYLISSRLKALQQARINDTISFEESRQEENKIVFSLNSLIFDYFPG
ncbi:MAG: serine/threonine protein kinase [Lewinellaceae bacterium]|nr:serine/threonine protein kinase [Lewinellaceae bacterium]